MKRFLAWLIVLAASAAFGWMIGSYGEGSRAGYIERNNWNNEYIEVYRVSLDTDDHELIASRIEGIIQDCGEQERYLLTIPGRAQFYIQDGALYFTEFLGEKKVGRDIEKCWKAHFIATANSSYGTGICKYSSKYSTSVSKHTNCNSKSYLKHLKAGDYNKIFNLK